ncbi:DUF1304 domain-containing protein [Urechidicola croceus]|uniref:DUF1304 domain-containing protein n=1 Tax=Urechidicola croceus TaxID=1850246 RepID=A0A1D8P8C8_9FLAO|nr:DUF1304 domain-containing protein [Urechidicola croceus]AOW20829.1 hypothetical protein LPB138_09135 [Urechidicola croceus]
MTTLQITFITLVAFLHIYFMILEMFLWTKPKGLKAFGLKKDFAEQSKVLAANQGLYNGFLSAGLIWSLIESRHDIAIFFLSCVMIAGIYGAYSTKKMKLFFIQSIPAIIGLLAIFIF